MLTKICMLAVLGLALCAIVKQWKADFAPLLRVGFVILFGTMLIAAVSPLLSFVRELGTLGGATEHTALLLKALGIALLTQFASQICRECGESAIADGVELTGKLELLLLALPLMKEVLAMSEALFSIGGGA